MKPRTALLASMLALGLLSLPVQSHPDQSRPPTSKSLRATMVAQESPFTDVQIVTSRKLFDAGISTFAHDAVVRHDSLGHELVMARIQSHRLADVSRMVHEKEKRCGGYFAFQTRAEAEAFIRSDRAAQTVSALAQANYPIDNHATVDPWLPQVQESRIRSTIQHLSTAYPNRYYASRHGRDAAIWIRDTWLALANGRSDATAELFEACAGCSTQPSVILTIVGSEHPDEIVVLGAHLDSISNSGNGDAMDAPGADDDASGIATLTEVIRIALADGWKPSRTIKFMGYAAEEVGLRGSNAIAQSFKDQGKNVVGALQLDMTNYAIGSPVTMRVITDYSNPGLKLFLGSLFDAYLAPLGLTRGTYTCGYGCSDHASWTSAGYPSAMMFEAGDAGGGDDPYIHTPLDTLANTGGTAAPSVHFAKLGLAFAGELAKTSAGQPTAVRVRSDFNGDGTSDILWRHTAIGINSLWLSADTAKYVPVTAVTNLRWHVAGVGDLDGDGKADVVWRNGMTGANTIWRSARSADYRPMTGVTNLNWEIAGVGDFDGDGNDDILWHNGATGASIVWKSADSTTRQIMTPVTDQDWKIAGVGDFNGDGKADVLWRNGKTGANTIWKSANSETQQGMSSVTNPAWVVANTGDFDGDGMEDVLWRHVTTGANIIWRSANSTTYQPMTPVTDMLWQIVGVGDFNGDGKSDVLWRNGSSGANTIWLSANKSRQQSVHRVANLSWKVVP